MKFSRFLSIIFIIAYMLVFQSCGNDNENGSITLSVDRSSVGTGSGIVAMVTVSSPRGSSVSGLPVSILSDNTDVIPNASGRVNSIGVANITLQPRSVITTQKIVNLIAEVDGLRSVSVPVTVTVPTLTMAPPADSTFAATGSINQKVRFVATNMIVTFKDSLGNPVQNQPITLTVDTINNQRVGDQVVFFPTAGTEVIAPPGTITVATDSAGTASIPVSIEIVTPSSIGSQHVITVIWKASANILGYNNIPLTFTASGATQTTVTN